MRSRALDISDPLIQREALDFINALQDLPEEQQQAFALLQAGFNNPEGFEAAQAALERITGAGVEVDSGTLAVGTADQPETELVLPGTDASIDFKSMMMQMFPELTVRIGENLDGWEPLDDFLLTPVEPNQVGQYIYDKSSAVRNITEIQAQVNAGERDVAGSLLPLAGSGLQVGFDVVTGAAGSGARFAGAEGITEDVGSLATKATEAVSEVFTAWAESGFRVETFGGKGISIMGEIDPTDPDYDWKIQQRLSAFGLLTFGLGGTLGPALGRRIKTVRGLPGKAAAEAALSSTRTIRRGGLLGTLAEVWKLPVRELTKKLDEQLVRLAKDPEAWWQSGLRTSQGEKITQVFDAAKKAHPGDIDGQLGFVAEVYGTGVFSPKLARLMLEQETVAGMRRAFVDFMADPVGQVSVSALRARKGALARKLKKV